jgi:hypothetical protein
LSQNVQTSWTALLQEDIIEIEVGEGKGDGEGYLVKKCNIAGKKKQNRMMKKNFTRQNEPNSIQKMFKPLKC